jgi:aminotransferase
MGLVLSQRLEWMMQSGIRTMSIACKRCNGIDLSQGDSDLPAPSAVREGAKSAIDRGVNTYTEFEGMRILREQIAFKQHRLTGLEIDPQSEIIISSGASGALYSALLALLNPGDEMVVFEPYYEYHLTTLRTAGVKPVFVKTSPPDWRFSFEKLKQVITPLTRGILINTPSNPSGKVFDRSELESIAALATRRDLFVFTDEIYEHFVYDDRTHVAPASLPGMRARTITVSGLSKTFSITGWRIGYCIVDARWSQAIGLFNDLVYACAPAPLQMGAAEGLKALGPEYYEKICRKYMLRRDMICEALSRAGLPPFVPGGGYFVLADIAKIDGKNSLERAMNLLKICGVACVPGEAFYHDGAGKNLGRFCFAKEDEIIAEACRRIAKIAPCRLPEGAP